MKRLIVVATLVTATALAMAEPPRGHGGRMADELNLSEEQRQEMRAIRDAGGSREDVEAVLTDEQREQAKALREEHQGRRAQRIEYLQGELDLTDDQVSQMRDIVESGGRREDVREVLTEEQQVRFDEIRKEHRKGKGRRSDG